MERKQLIIIGSIVGGLAVVGLIVLVIFLRIRATADLQPITTANTPSGPAVQVPVGSGQMDENQTRLAEQEREQLAARPKDTDGDGLTDDEEAQLGTDSNNGDTDSDGYNDWEEVKTLKTSPTQADTDALQKRIDDTNRRLSTVSSTRPETPSQTEPTQPTTPAPSTPSPDADGDGLTAEQEINVGTDPNNADTDGDGLSDRQEVETYKTDPLRADSDNDTFNDGGEVQSGYNPLGPGRCARQTCIP
jgi:hypothetical protein